MTNEQRRIAELEAQNQAWEAWYAGQQQQQPKTTAKKAKKPVPTPKKGGAFEAKFFAFLLILSIFAIGYLTEQWNRAGEQSARATKTTRK